MTIRYKCEECGAALNINDELAGTEGSCPRCHVEFVVPTAEEAAAAPAKKEKPSSGGSLSTEDEIGDFLSSDEIPVVTGRSSLTEADASDSDSGASDNPFDDDAPREQRKRAEDEKLEVAGKKKKAKSPEDGKGKKSDTFDSAAIARSLMGKGEAAVEEPAEPEKKKKRKQFGEGSDRPEGEISSARDIVTYFAKLGWPALVGVVAVTLITYWVYSRMQKRLDLPPLAKVSGIVTIDGKAVSAGTIIRFIPEEAARNIKLANSVGITDPEGKYSLQYAIDAPGAVIGKHRVLIEPSDPSQRIPDRYRLSSTTDVIVEVTTGGKPIDIPLKSDPVPAG